MIGNAPVSPNTGVPGWMTDDEENMLARYASMLQPDSRIVNIGVEYGRSVSVLASVAPQANVFGVELNPIPALDQNLNEINLPTRPTIFVGDSKVIGREWDRGEIDLLFVDGAHEFENVKGDIEAWARHVRVGGYIIFHDVAQTSNRQPHYLHFEVTRAITEWTQSQSEFEAVGAVDSLAVFHRVAKSDAQRFWPNGGVTQYTPPEPPEKAKNDFKTADGDTLEVVEASDAPDPDLAAAIVAQNADESETDAPKDAEQPEAEEKPKIKRKNRGA